MYCNVLSHSTQCFRLHKSTRPPNSSSAMGNSTVNNTVSQYRTVQLHTVLSTVLFLK